MKNYDAKDVSINIGGQEIYGFGDDKYYTKDNSKENQDRLRDNFKYAQSEPIPAAIGRHNGEALNPQLHPLKDLLKQKRNIGTQKFEALYQQSPVIEGGNIMPEPNKFIDWITERDLSKTPFISIDDKQAINLAEVLHIKACKVAKLKKTHNGK